MYETADAETIDLKITKKVYPRTNNAQCLDFIIEKDPHLFLMKNKILLRGAIEVDTAYVPDCNWVSKLFSMMTIELDSQIISKNSTRFVSNLILIIN